MADSASEMESDTSSIDGAATVLGPPRKTMESHVKRIESLTQENRVLRMEIDTLKLKNKALQSENKELRQTSVNIVSHHHPLIITLLLLWFMNKHTLMLLASMNIVLFDFALE